MSYEKNSNGTYVDLEFTSFPAAVDSWQNNEDVPASLLSVANEYKTYLQNGDYERAQNILVKNPRLKNMLVSSKDINEMKNAIMAIERFYTEDVQDKMTDYVSTASTAATNAENAKNTCTIIKGAIDEARNNVQTNTETVTTKAKESLDSADAAKTSETNAETSATNAKGSETKSAEYLQSTKEYFEQVRTITIGAQGWYESTEALTAAVPIGENGWWAVVGSTDTIWTWDSDTNAWKDSVQKADLSDFYTKAQVDALIAAQKLADHPIGSMFLTIANDDPAALFGGTWEQIASERVLMGASSRHAAGTTVEAGLPDITGTETSFAKEFGGAFTKGKLVDEDVGASTGNGVVYRYCMNFNASNSNAIYGASSTVQPAAYYVHMWLRTA